MGALPRSSEEAQARAERVAEMVRARDTLAHLLGIELMEVRPGYSRARLQLTSQLQNFHGMPHGAAIFALADVCFAAACNSHGQTAVALSVDLHFLRSPAPQALLEGEAEEVRRGRRTGLYRMTVREVGGEAVAEMHGMAYIQGEAFLSESEEQGSRAAP